jgi:hypothetical protein
MQHYLQTWESPTTATEFSLVCQQLNTFSSSTTQTDWWHPTTSHSLKNTTACSKWSILRVPQLTKLTVDLAHEALWSISLHVAVSFNTTPVRRKQIDLNSSSHLYGHTVNELIKFEPKNRRNEIRFMLRPSLILWRDMHCDTGMLGTINMARPTQTSRNIARKDSKPGLRAEKNRKEGDLPRKIAGC